MRKKNENCKIFLNDENNKIILGTWVKLNAFNIEPRLGIAAA